MDSKRILTSFFFLVAALPMTASAYYCVTWVMCPYKQEQGDPRTRYLAIEDAELPGPTDTQNYVAFTVRGNEDGFGQALVCIEVQTYFNKAHVEELVSSVGCEVVPRDQVKSKLIGPYVPGFDEQTQKWFFLDGRDGRETVTYPDPDVSRINDSAVK